jgi:hypothetical protein
MLTLHRRPLVWVALSALGLVIVGRAAFAAANTIPVSSAGYASKAVSGFTITAIDYNMNATDPRNLDTVTFTATADNGDTGTALTIRVRFNSATTDWYTCSRTGGVAPAHNISCTVDGTGTPAVQLTVANANTFDAAIVQQ